MRDWPGRLAVSAAVVLLFNSGVLAWLLFHWGGQHTMTVADNIAQFAGPLLVLPLCWPWRGETARLALPSLNRLRIKAPALIGCGIACFAIGQMIWAYYELIAHQPTPFPSAADVFFLLSYPFLMSGVLLIPRRRLTTALRVRLAVDCLIIMAAVITFSWYFILGPTIQQNGESTLAKVIGTVYPLWDIALVACLLVLAVQAGTGVPLRAIFLIGAGLVSGIVADSYFDYTTLQNTYATGALPDVCWPLSYMLLGLGAYVLRHTLSTERQALPHPRIDRKLWWASFVPYGLLPAVFALLIYVSRFPGDPGLRLGVEIGSALLIGLVMLRQAMAITENRRLSARLAARNKELQQANVRLQALATTDPHTDLLNHRAIVETLNREIERAQRYGRPCSVLFLDLDHFKALNDSLGHQAGDTALRQLAATVRSILRSIDVVGRWGGEEFLAILPESDAAMGLQAAERIRAAVACQPFGEQARVRLTCSIGLATFPEDATDSSGLVQLADQAMYAAKRLGRNQVRRAGTPIPADALVTPDEGDPHADETVMSAVESLARLVDARDLQTGRHVEEVGHLSIEIALALGLDMAEARRIGLAGRLHDIGKVAIPDAILQKPAQLSAEDWAQMRLHPAIGADVLLGIPKLRSLAPMVRSHHEWWDGTGYPDHLSGEDIPLGARIIALADALCAMRADRPYRPGLSRAEAQEEIVRRCGTQFDPTVVAALDHITGAVSPGISA